MAQDPGADFRLIVRDRIVLHLLDNIRVSEEFELPPSLTQDGIAEAVGVARSHIAQEVKNLIQGALVEERMSHIQGGARRRKAYTLAPEGGDYARELKERLLERNVSVRTPEGGKSLVTLDAAWEMAGRDVAFLRLVQTVGDDGVLVLDGLVTPEPDGKDSRAGAPKRDDEKESSAPPGDDESKDGSGKDSRELSDTCPSCGKISTPVISPPGGIIAPIDTSPDYCHAAFIPVQPLTAPQPSTLILPGKINYPGLSAGLAMLFASIMPFMLNLDIVCFLGSALLSFAGIVLVYLGIRRADTSIPSQRAAVMATGGVFLAMVISVYLSIFEGRWWEAEPLRRGGLLAFLSVSLFALTFAGRFLPDSTRRELGTAAGVFMLLFGVACVLYPVLFDWPYYYGLFWALAGGLLAFTVHEVNPPTCSERPQFIGEGVGLAVIAVCLGVASANAVSGPMLIAISLWAAVGSFPVLARLLPLEKRYDLAPGLTALLPMTVGSLFGVVGVLLLYIGQYPEAMIELVLMLPFLKYGTDRYGNVKTKIKYIPELLIASASVLTGIAFIGV